MGIYRGIELDKLLELSTQEVVAMLRSRARRRFRRGIHSRYDRLIKKLTKSVKDASYGEKPTPVKTHLRNAMVGDYLGEYSMTYKPIRHGKVGVGATRGSK